MIRFSQPGAAPENTELFDLTDRGLLLADGVFDTSRVVGGRIIQKRAHLMRLASDAAALGVGANLSELDALAQEAVPQNANGALRLTVTRGPGGRGLAGAATGAATLLARFSPMDVAFPMPPVRLRISNIRRNPTSPSARHKTLSYTDNIMALREAMAMGYDEALLLSPEGRVACASAANVFALFGNLLVTPPLSEGVLPGVVRGWLIGAAREAGLETAQESLTPERLSEADSIFLTNSLRIFQPVSEFAGQAFETELPAALIGLGKTLLEGGFDD
ncbi:aminotransferase, class IV [Hyphomonas neptunium ATCC 15444]|uniref:Probable branched-chain-amino-acid aminotransferase n=2 Tax=Hyphomonas TaxID=85 RepID=Q0BZN1_HYPNA|nr:MULTISPECIES: aminotransferase class IV [Hyphomonas]ABI75598.1 aminotransferase, class IV [Hyphomonas neptunium ATCC 15444]KCZ86761.1 class IV aminotransferase [Hyphomonas hirschiana VP5]